jgi:hypothetical protein
MFLAFWKMKFSASKDGETDTLTWTLDPAIPAGNTFKKLTGHRLGAEAQLPISEQLSNTHEGMLPKALSHFRRLSKLC